MSAIGNYTYNLGNQYNVYCTDLSVYELQSTSFILPANAIIISSPTTKGIDKGIPAIIMTDYDSNVLPLTYTLKPSNAFTVDTKNNQIGISTYYLGLADRIGRIEMALKNRNIL